MASQAKVLSEGPDHLIQSLGPKGRKRKQTPASIYFTSGACSPPTPRKWEEIVALTLSHSTMFSSISLSAEMSSMRRRVRWALWYLIKTSLFCTYLSTKSWTKDKAFLNSYVLSHLCHVDLPVFPNSQDVEIYKNINRGLLNYTSPIIQS